MRDKATQSKQAHDISRDLFAERKEEEKKLQVNLKKEIHALESELLSAPWHVKIYDLENQIQALGKELKYLSRENEKLAKVRDYE